VNPATEESVFLELRRKVRHSELLSASIERLLLSLHFSGRLSIVVQNGRVLKSGYEEGYFSHRGNVRLLGDPRTRDCGNPLDQP
jgi:hypothetical protein